MKKRGTLFDSVVIEDFVQMALQQRPKLRKGMSQGTHLERRVLWTVVKASVKALRLAVWGQREDFWVRMELCEAEHIGKWGLGGNWGRSSEPSRPW